MQQPRLVMEIAGFDHTTVTTTPTVRQTQHASLNMVPVLEPHAWLPNLEDYLYSENNFKPSNVLREHEQISAAKDTLCDQIVQMEEFDREAIQEYTSSSERKGSSNVDGITVEVINSGKQATASEDTKETEAPNPWKTQNTAFSSPKTSRKAPDHRRRREKANEREKQRIVVLKSAMNVLKNAIPAARDKTKITKLEVLKLARDYINSLRAQLADEQTGGYESSSSDDNSDLFVYCNSAP